MAKTVPSYINILNNNLLKDRVDEALTRLEKCNLCPRKCNVNRLENEIGYCKIGRYASVSSHNLHFGEEPPISGTKGSGTIFFSKCNLRCKFCQNYPISQLNVGEVSNPSRLSEMMLSLQKRGAHNINLVTPSHVIPQFLEGLLEAAENGLRIPIVWNSNGYESVDALKLLDGVVDIYLPDIKYSNDESSKYCSDAPNYFSIAKLAIKEMFKQTGTLLCDENGIAIKGLLIRHLVLPDNLSGTKDVLYFIANELSNKIPVNLMSQYFPAWHSANDMKLSRKITKKEYEDALKILEDLELNEGWIQPLDESENG